MAVVLINKVKKSIHEALDYIVNPDKTDGGCLVSSFSCSSDPTIATKEFNIANNFALRKRKDSIIAQHIKQSFSPEDNITPHKAHQIGLDFCKRVFKDEYQFIISTHTDKKHIHNHIIFNTTNIKTNKKYRSNKTTYKELQKISDELCSGNNLYVIPPKMSKEKGKKYKEWSEDKKGKSFKSILKKDIDTCIKISSNYEEFKANMQKIGYEIKDYNSKGEYLKYISFKNESIGMIKFIRGRDTLLGERYTRENIQLRIISKHLKAEIKDNKIDKIIDVNKNEKARNISGYRNFSNSKNIDTLSQTKIYMSEHNLSNFDELKTHTSNLLLEIRSLQGELSELQKNYNESYQVISAYTSYKDNLKIYNEYSSIKDKNEKKIFYVKHKTEIQNFINAKDMLIKAYPDKSIPKLYTLEKYNKELQEKLTENMVILKKLEEEYKNSKTAQKNMDTVLHSDLREEIKKKIER